jgi:predicted dehydrogenase
MHFEASYLQSWLSSHIWGDWKTESMWLWRLSTQHGSQGVLGDIGVHILDLAGFPIGEYRSIQCRLKTFHKAPDDQIGNYTLDANDSFVANVEMQDGAMGTIHASRWATGYQNRLTLTIHGTKGALRLDLDQSYNELEVCLGEDVDTVNWQTLVCDPTPNNQKRFIRSIQTGVNDQPDFARGSAVQKVIDACFESDRSGQIIYL